MSKVYRVHKNLNNGKYSITHKGIVVAWAISVHLINAKFVVSAAGNARARQQNQRNVHAFVEGHIVNATHVTYKDGRSIELTDDPGLKYGFLDYATYNPFKHISFRLVSAQQPADKVYDRVECCGDGKVRLYSDVSNPPNIVFLDIDGVLNNEQSDTEHFAAKVNGKPTWLLYSPSRVELLNTLITRANAKLVVSSTWRLGETIKSMQEILFAMGVQGEVIGITKDLRHTGYTVRGNEIFDWIKTHENIVGDYFKYKNYVILDDDSDMLLWQQNNFIQTDPEIGFSSRDLCRALKILNVQLNLLEDDGDL